MSKSTAAILLGMGFLLLGDAIPKRAAGARIVGIHEVPAAYLGAEDCHLTPELDTCESQGCDSKAGTGADFLAGNCEFPIFDGCVNGCKGPPSFCNDLPTQEQGGSKTRC